MRGHGVSDMYFVVGVTLIALWRMGNRGHLLYHSQCKKDFNMTSQSQSRTSTQERSSHLRYTCGAAMCTYNGNRFLLQQLDSLVAQTRCLDEIVICDDCSEDGSWEAITSWATRVSADYGIAVTAVRNVSRLGVARNFEQAIGMLTTDLIFLADQDDIWMDNKVQFLAGCLESQPDNLLAHSDATLINDRGDDLGTSLLEALRVSAYERTHMREGRVFEVYCRRNLVTGTTAVFRRSLLSTALPIPDDWIHDEWLAVCAAMRGDVLTVPLPLTAYRQHGSNAIGIPVSLFLRILWAAKQLFRMRRTVYLEYKLRRLGQLKALVMSANSRESRKLEVIQEAMAHFERRLKFAHPRVLRVGSVFHEIRIRGYQRFAEGLVAAARDLIQR